MAQIKQVMKGPNEVLPFDHPHISYPQLASNKMDGFRLLNLCGEHLLSPALKPFPNRHMQEHLGELLDICAYNRHVTDGEFWSPEISFQDLQSIVRSHDKPIPSHVKYYIFDTLTEDEWNNGTEPGFLSRYLSYTRMFNGIENVVVVPQVNVNSAAEAQNMFDTFVANGQEGIILRAQNAKYKHGRTTVKQDGMWKFKQFITHDAVIVAMVEGEKMRDGIERTFNAMLGTWERTYKQEDYEPSGMVGAFIVRQEGYPDFKVKPGRGHDNAWKTMVWQDYCKYPEKWRGKHLEYKFMPHGTMDRPRIGNLIRLRPDLD